MEMMVEVMVDWWGDDGERLMNSWSRGFMLTANVARTLCLFGLLLSISELLLFMMVQLSFSIILKHKQTWARWVHLQESEVILYCKN